MFKHIWSLLLRQFVIQSKLSYILNSRPPSTNLLGQVIAYIDGLLTTY